MKRIGKKQWREEEKQSSLERKTIAFGCRFYRALALVLAFALLASLTACGEPSTGEIFRYDLTEPIDNLDPQYTTSPSAKLVLHNMFEGLVRKKADGSIEPLTAERWEISPDGLTYTFHLYESRTWAPFSNANGKEEESKPVTAQDFLFAFYRIYGKSSVSPYRERFSAIAGAKEIMEGTGEISSLGIRAKDATTLVFTLTEPDPLFLDKLSTSAAFPCNADFFQTTKGRYGLERKLTLGNGPFRMTQWVQTGEKKYIYLRENPTYDSPTPVSAGGVNFFLQRENPAGEFISGKTDVIRATGLAQEEKIISKASRTLTYPETVWCISFNTSDPIWSMPLLRQAFAHTADFSQLGETLTSPFSPADKLVPESVLLGDKSLADRLSGNPITFDPVKGQEYYNFSLKTLGLERMPNVILYVPDTGEHQEYMEELQQSWQQHLSLYVNVKPQSKEEEQERLRTGDYGMMLVPITSPDSSADGFFRQFSDSGVLHYDNRVYKDHLDNALEGSSLPAIETSYDYAHHMLLEGVFLLPVYSQPATYAFGNGAEGLEVYPFGEVIYFKEGIK